MKKLCCPECNGHLQIKVEEEIGTYLLYNKRNKPYLADEVDEGYVIDTTYTVICYRNSTHFIPQKLSKEVIDLIESKRLLDKIRYAKGLCDQNCVCKKVLDKLN